MIELRDLQDDDGERLFGWRRRPEVDRWMSGPAPADLQAHRRWFEGLLASSDRRAWIIALDQAPVGLLSLGGLQGPHGRVDWGWYLAEPAARGRGVGRAAQALGLDQAFGLGHVRKVCSEVLADNAPALKAQAAAGFRREGYLRGHVLKGGEVHDLVVLGVLRAEWMDLRKQVLGALAGSGMIAAGAGPA